MNIDQQVAATDSDLALLNSGTFRSDRVHAPGPFTLRDLNNILPMLDPLIVVEITGYFPMNLKELPATSLRKCVIFVLKANKYWPL
jgi:hypothetical protein